MVIYYSASGGSTLELDGRPVTGEENAAPFRVSWASPTQFYYVSDGKIRMRTVGGSVQTIPFAASLPVTTRRYAHRRRDFESVAPRAAQGIVRPMISPDGTKVAFAALNDLYVRPIGGKADNVTNDRAFDTDPAWSPDGARLVYSSDRGGDQLQLWIRDVRTGQSRQLTHMPTPPQGATWSPDGKRIAFFNVVGGFRVAQISVVDVDTQAVQTLSDRLSQPGTPSWSPDGKRLALAGLAQFSKRFREGTNQILTIASDHGGDAKWYAPIPTLSIDSRAGCGPAWSPDGTKMAAIYEGMLAVWPVSAAGEPLGPPRHVTTESANSPSWQGDSRHILYQSYDRLRIVDIVTGESRDVPINLKYTLDVPPGRVVVHAGRLVDMKSPEARTDVDIVIDGNRITSVGPHSANLHRSGQVVDASALTAMPGLIDWHTHLQPDFGEAQGRAFLSFGVTTVQSPGGVPYEAVEERESTDGHFRTGPRVFSTGYLLEYKRVYYKMGIAISSPAHLEMELERAKVLQYDLLKSYVRLPDLQQKRVVEFAHTLGILVLTHEIYPASFVGVDSTEHTHSTSRRGYSMKQGPLNTAYDDFVQLIGKSGRIFDATISEDDIGTAKLFADDPSLQSDQRFGLYPAWLREQVSEMGTAGARGTRPEPLPLTGRNGNGKMVMDAMHAGAVIVAGTDRPLAIKVHGDLVSDVQIGMTPYEALKTATVNPARALALDAGTIEAGKLADIAIVDGNPLDNVENAHKVKWVIANGRVYTVDDLVRGLGGAKLATAQATSQ
jgi:hypothetical protein